MTAGALRWTLLALLGLLVAIAIAFLATRTVSQDIGISSEPPTVGRDLSPAAPTTTSTGPAGTTTVVSPTATITVPGKSPSGGGDGESGDD